MLRRVAFQNFMFFREHQLLELQDGPNFFIGANATGKSGTIELIRRCLSGTANASTSNLSEESRPAFTICEFEIKNELSQEVPADSMLYSLLVANQTNGEKKIREKKIYKMVLVQTSNTAVVTYYLDIHTYHDKLTNKPNTTKSYVNKEEGKEPVTIEKIKKILKPLNGNVRAPEQLLKLLQDIESKSHAANGVVTENILEEITAAFTCTFPIRSPGPIQWSHSKRVGSEHREENYKMASNKSEIIKELLPLPDDELDQAAASEEFQMIINPLKYSFGIDPESKMITVEDCQGRDIPLLKTPEGIIEAKQFALILAHKKYQTICFEEPDRGMHPPMIQKMRELVLRKHRHQVIILTSHSPAMTSNWTFERVFVFRRKRDHEGIVTHSISKLDTGMIYKKFNQQQDMLKQLIYSSSVLFVEGQTDKMVIDMLFNKILESDSYPDLSSEEFKHLRQIVSETQIMATDGSKTYSLWKNMTEKIDVPHAFLFDKDAAFECEAEIPPKKEESEKNPKKKDKWKENALLCVKVLLGKIQREATTPIEQKNSRQTEQGNTMNIKNQLKFLNNDLENGKTVKDFLQINDQELDSNTLPFHKVETFMDKIVLPKIFVKVKDTVEKVYNISTKTYDLTMSHFQEKKRIHMWKSGNLEDMICTCILADDEQTDKKFELMRDIFSCHENYKQFTNPKDPIKETIKQMDYEKAEKIAKCLWGKQEISDFFGFLLRPPPQIEEV